MNILTRYRQRKAAQRLAATLKPKPDYVRRRMAQLSPERRAHWVMTAGIFSPEIFERKR